MAGRAKEGPHELEREAIDPQLLGLWFSLTFRRIVVPCVPGVERASEGLL